MPTINPPSIHHQPGACWPRMIMVFRYGLQTMDHFHRPMGRLGLGSFLVSLDLVVSLDGGRKKVDWGDIWMRFGEMFQVHQKRCPLETGSEPTLQSAKHQVLSQSSCPTAAEPVEAEWSSPYRSWCKPVRTCGWTRSFPTSYGKYQSNIAQNSTYHSTSVCQHFYSNIARLLFTVEILLCHSYACLHVRKPWAKIAKGLCRNRVQGPKSHGHLEAGLEKTELTTSLKDMNTCLHLSSLLLGWFVARDLGSTWKPKARSRLWVALATKLHGIAAWGHTSDDCRGYALASRIWQPHVSSTRARIWHLPAREKSISHIFASKDLDLFGLLQHVMFENYCLWRCCSMW